MGQLRRSTFAWPRSMAVLSWALVLVLTSTQPAYATDNAPERERLTALVRQIELAERLSELAASTTPQERNNRNHFDHARLHQDIERIRQGIHDYLTPQRAQPRDPVKLLGDYSQPDRPSDVEEAQ